MSTSRDTVHATIVPVFPLPNAVLFPHTILPLHVFEARYREMMRDALAGDGQLVIALPRTGQGKDDTESPPLHSVGTIGRIEELQLLEDGRFLFHLVGVQRADLEETPSTEAYRLVRATPRPDLGVDDGDPELNRSKLELLASHGMLMRELGADDGSNLVLNEELTFESAVNGVCANLPAVAEVRQQLLETDDLRLRHRHALQVINRLLRDVLALRPASTDRPSADLN